MDHLWLKHYPAGVPHEIDTSIYRSVVDLLEESMQKYADQPFSVCMDVWMSYRELEQRSRQLGAWLQSLQLEPGARVAIMLPNIPQFAVTMAAVLRAGYTCVNVNPLYTARELEHQLKDSGATAIVILENFAHTLAEVLPRSGIRHICLTAMGDLLGPVYGRWITFAVRHLAKMVPAFELPLNGCTLTPFRTALSRGAQRSLERPQLDHDSIAFLQYTGGTTGLAKGAVLTHRNIIAATLQAEAWFAPAYEGRADMRKLHGIAALPLYHIFALTLLLLTLRQGSSLSLIPNPRDIPKFVAVLRKRPFHTLPAVNTLFNALLQNEQFRQIDFSSLAVTQAGGMAASEGTALQWQKVTGRVMVEGWGMSETCAIGTNNPVNATTFSGTIGLPLPSVEIAIKDDDGNDLPIGAAGEICIRGPNVMQGYYNMPKDTAEAIDEEGWLHSGDLGIMDEDGYVSISGRIKDMIIRGGENVYPREVEEFLLKMDGVADVQVVAVPSRRYGEEVGAFLIPKEGADVAPEDVRDYCRGKIAWYKIPRYVAVVEGFPLTASGKIQKYKLREMAAAYFPEAMRERNGLPSRGRRGTA